MEPTIGFPENFIAATHYLSSIFEKTVFMKSAYLDTLITGFSATIGLREDYVRLFASTLISFPLVFFQNLIKSPKLKKLYSIICGVTILQFCFGVGWIHSLTSSVVVYCLIRFCDPRKQPVYVFVFSLLYLSLSLALYTMLTDYLSYSLDSTTYQMMLISRFQMLAWAYHDGTFDRVHVDKGVERTDRWGRIYKKRQSEYITEFPSLLDYFGFVYHYPGLLGGPNTYYREYHDVMSNIRYEYNMIPKIRWLYVIINCIKGIICILIFIIGSIYFPTDYLLTNEYGSLSLIIRIIILYITFVVIRCRYYGIWKITEGLCITSGFGEREINGEKDWNGISNADIMAFETCQNMSVATHVWNKRTQKWLQMCIYERTNFNQFYVFMVSAFWHGFYPSYYLCFGVGSIMQFASHLTSKKLWPRVEGTWMEKIYLRLGNICVIVIGSFMLQAMFNYSFDKALLGWKQASYFGLYLLFGGLLVLFFIPDAKIEKKEKKE